jgi:hypothetical protein
VGFGSGRAVMLWFSRLVFCFLLLFAWCCVGVLVFSIVLFSLLLLWSMGVMYCFVLPALL